MACDHRIKLQGRKKYLQIPAPDASSAHTRSGCLSPTHPSTALPVLKFFLFMSSHPGCFQDTHLYLRGGTHLLRPSWDNILGGGLVLGSSSH